MTRDLTRAQFWAACERAGFTRTEVSFMGYYRLAPPFQNTSVSILNAGDRRRDQLAYLHAEQAKQECKALEAIR
jgi:hypothetical protein